MGCCKVRGLLWRVGLFLLLLTARPAATGHVASNHGKGGRGVRCGRAPENFTAAAACEEQVDGRRWGGSPYLPPAAPVLRAPGKREGRAVAGVGASGHPVAGRAQCSRRPRSVAWPLLATEGAEGARGRAWRSVVARRPPTPAACACDPAKARYLGREKRRALLSAPHP